MTETTDRIIKCVQDAMDEGGRDMTRETRLSDDLNVDDIDLIEILLHLEGEFGLTILESDAERWQTVGDIVDYIEHRLAA